MTTTEETFPAMVIRIGIDIGFIISSQQWSYRRRFYSANKENNRSSTISSKPVKEDGMTYLNYLKAKSIAP